MRQIILTALPALTLSGCETPGGNAAINIALPVLADVLSRDGESQAAGAANQDREGP